MKIVHYLCRIYKKRHTQTEVKLGRGVAVLLFNKGFTFCRQFDIFFTQRVMVDKRWSVVVRKLFIRLLHLLVMLRFFNHLENVYFMQTRTMPVIPPMAPTCVFAQQAITGCHAMVSTFTAYVQLKNHLFRFTYKNRIYDTHFQINQTFATNYNSA